MLTQDQIVTVMQDGVMTILKCSLPMIMVALIIGIIISIFQAATQINEQTLSFAPKIIGILITLLVCVGWLVATLSDFVARIFNYISLWVV